MEPYLAEIRLFAGNFAPRAWMLCMGQLLSIAENDALFSLLGTTYGGDGQTTFALPNFSGRLATGTGQGPGLSNIVLGEMSGTENVTLTSLQMPAHNHIVDARVNIKAETGTSTLTNDPTNNFFGENTAINMYTSTANAAMGSSPANVQIQPAGGNNPFSIMQPYLGLNFIIAVEGIYPSRN